MTKPNAMNEVIGLILVLALLVSTAVYSMGAKSTYANTGKEMEAGGTAADLFTIDKVTILDEDGETEAS